MGFANHGGMWGDLLLLPVANAVIVPHLTSGLWIAPSVALGCVLSVWVHVHWYRGGASRRGSTVDSRGRTVSNPQSRAHVAIASPRVVVEGSVVGGVGARRVRGWRARVVDRFFAIRNARCRRWRCLRNLHAARAARPAAAAMVSYARDRITANTTAAAAASRHAMGGRLSEALSRRVGPVVRVSLVGAVASAIEIIPFRAFVLTLFGVRGVERRGCTERQRASM